MTKRMGAGVRLEGNTVIMSGVEHLVGAPVMATDLRTTRRYFAAKGDQIEVIRLYGSMELAPLVGLADRIVDLVAPTGSPYSKPSPRSAPGSSSTRLP